MMTLDFFDPFPLLSTARLELRAITDTDVEALFALFSDEAVMEHWSSPPYPSIEDARALVRRIDEGYQGKAAIEWGIVEKGGDRLIGKCCFHKIYRQHFRAEIGYALARPSWGSGRMVEALAAIIDFGFERMGLHSIEAQVDPANTRSVKTLERLGFQQEGHLRENFCVAGKFSDTLILSLLRR